ncbi:IS3 family transposase [Salegentibacter sp. F188]|uniref:IS3 family transposase n=1 Tax=Autumnicola patrickiae TaxID=3075591 RepID=A0ABU3E7G8_9FLAO|nr:IS3 family transposase [Salegentibacter sp. F188]MDT0691944.1 IS3 family transposase [Salegentibacter sp. F188]
MNKLYTSIGVSKQAVHQYARRQRIFDNQLMQLMEEADDLRREHPGCGVEKMYHILKPDFIGRDRFVETFMQLGYRLKRKKNYRRTTIAGKIYYPNQIKGLKINAPSMVWQSDITYYRVKDKFYYAVFIIDIYSKSIVGYNVSDHMRGAANVQALKMALKENKAPKIHHSDRGSQYTYKTYTDLLKANSTTVSMALSAQDNAYAERINKTIKEEYLDHWQPQTFSQLKRQVKRAVKNYNNKRSHNHLEKRNPNDFINYWSTLNPEKRPVITIFDNEN